MSISMKRSPVTSDGRPIYLTSRFRGNVDPFFAGSGDNENGRGQDDLFCLHWATAPTEAEDKTQTFGFCDWIYIAKGTVQWCNAGPGDYVSFHAFAPATTVTPNTDAGNCNLVATGLGFNTIIPAAGNGSHDYADPVPVPAFNAAGEPNGHWLWSEPDAGKGDMTFKGDGAQMYNLYDATLPLVYWIKKLPLIGNHSALLQPETKARKVLPHWKFKVTVHNESLGALQATWHLDCARKSTL
jgi:hypothetical protein